MGLRSLFFTAALGAVANAFSISVGNSGGNESSPYQYGLIFEDINHSIDGGIYAELIQNRAFQGSSIYPSSIFPWFATNGAVLTLQNLTMPLSTALPTSVNVAASPNTNGTVGLVNPGYWGIDVKQQPYNGTFFVNGDYTGNITVSLQSNLSSQSFGSLDVAVQSTSSQWTQYNYTFTPSSAANNSNNTFMLSFDPAKANGSLNFNLISLFPPTYNNRPNGNRVDLMEALANLKNSFIRMPGGNNIEGVAPPYHWYWNQTIGPLKDRPGYPGTWGYENTNGLGLIEWMLWAQDLDLTPVFAVWSGEYLDATIIPENELQPYIDDALNELEFLNGDTSTTYGALRASLGYPQPFGIKFVEVGNEDMLNTGLDSYCAYRFPMFYEAISKAYPDIYIIGSTVDCFANQTNGTGGDYHQYAQPNQFVAQFDFFDQNTSDHKILAGEYACVQPNQPNDTITPGFAANFSIGSSVFPFWECTVSEAIYLIGAERNTDKMIGAAYAPTFQNLNSYEWGPDMISFTADPSQTVLSTSYHMLQLFGTTRLTSTLPINNGTYGPVYYVAGINNVTGNYLLKAAVYNSTNFADVPMEVSFEGAPAGTANLTVLTAPSGPYAHNDIGVNIVQTNVTTISPTNGTFSFSLPNYSVALLEITPSSSKSLYRHRSARE